MSLFVQASEYNDLTSLSIDSFIDNLFLYKEDIEKFDDLIKNCSKENFFALQGFNFFKSKRPNDTDNSREQLEKNKEALCRSIITYNNPKYVKFFMPYSLIGWILKNYTNDFSH